MFSGIIEELGKVRKISRSGGVIVLEVAARNITDDLKIGDSVSVNGACLTLVAKNKDLLKFDVMPETAKCTNLGTLRAGDEVNLERSLKVGDRISGHFVSGHVDCVGIIRKKSMQSGNLCFEIAIPAAFVRYCVLKGSIAIDGISLTIMKTASNIIHVYIIPHTLKNTTLGFKGPSSAVNIEFDILIKASRLP